MTALDSGVPNPALVQFIEVCPDCRLAVLYNDYSAARCYSDVVKCEAREMGIRAGLKALRERGTVRASYDPKHGRIDGTDPCECCQWERPGVRHTVHIDENQTTTTEGDRQ